MRMTCGRHVPEVDSEQHMQQAAKSLLAGAALHHGGSLFGETINAVTE